MRKEIPLALTFISGFLLLVAFFIPHEPLGSLEERFTDWYIIVVGFTMILGIDSLIVHHWDKIKRKKEGWIHSVALIISFVATVFWGFYSGIQTGHFLSPESSFREYFYLYIFVPLQATMFALLAFFIASAAYRAFRARTRDATLLLVAAALVMLGRVPGGENAMFPLTAVVMVLFAIFLIIGGRGQILPWKKTLYFGLAVLCILLIYPLGLYLQTNLAAIADWIMNVPQLAAKRGILIGVALGAIAMALRIILGIERAYLK
jgi:hypothetical protein